MKSLGHSHKAHRHPTVLAKNPGALQGAQEQDRGPGHLPSHLLSPSRYQQPEAFSASDGHFDSIDPDGFFCHEMLFEPLSV